MPATSRTLPHVGEWKVELRADSREELFAELARALGEEAGGVETPRAPGPWEPIALAARDDATLLVDWANELIGRSEAAGRIYDRTRNIAIAGAPLRLTGEIAGREAGPAASAVKAATYHGAVVEREHAGAWRAVVLFDI